MQKTVAKHFLRARPKLQGVRFTLHFSCAALDRDKILLFPAVHVQLQPLLVSPLQLWALFIILFIIFLVQQMARLQRGVNFSSVTQQPGPKQAMFPCQHF